ncbi:D-2-hydroxyacid dehydrogenase [Roseiarcaceae bacterium H3SJ34-1]|uniref:D-2-hydroxyacid dehydrogenase n=1 Tax=Terripilifer ovatus TaxID=3032367 RepID=UPI003AB9B3D4|nr:D-2-hydroxyacid dehydrogenase [Roseiarcaceae bacterium H3SJ34-1]
MKIVYWAHMALAEPAITSKLKAVKDIDLSIVRSFEELKAALVDADGLVAPDPHEHMAADVGELLRSASSLKWLHVVTAGREGFNLARVPERIVVTGPAGAHSPALAEHAFAFLLAFTRQIPLWAQITPTHKWERGRASAMSSVEGRTLAIVGLGHAGLEVAKRAKVFGMTVITATRTPKENPLVDEVHPLTELKEVLGRADFIVITIAQTNETRGLIGAAEFAVCKPSAYLINVARGAIIDQAALLEALQAGKIAGAGIDVTDPEPLPPTDPLWGAPNIIISPHCGGGGSTASMARLAGRVIENLERFRAGTLRPS